MTDAEENIVEFRGVDFGFGSTDRPILDDLSFKINKGETFVLLGESGCGKTTTLRLVNRLLEPTRGEVLVRGRATRDWDPIELRRGIGYVMQDGGLFPHFTVAENVAAVPSLTGSDADVDGLLATVGLEPRKFAARFPHELSGGQRQRVGVARALAADPEIMLLDEPFGALDALTRAGLQREFARLVRELGKTAVFVTHDLHEAFVLGTRVCLMEKGRIALLDTPANFRASEHPLVRRYLETVELAPFEQ